MMRLRFLTTKALTRELQATADPEKPFGYPPVLRESANSLLGLLLTKQSTPQEIADEWVRERERWNRRYLHVGPFPPVWIPMPRPRPIHILEKGRA